MYLYLDVEEKTLAVEKQQADPEPAQGKDQLAVERQEEKKEREQMASYPLWLAFALS